MSKLKISKLKSGLPVFLADVPGAKTATVLIMFKTGSKHETRRQSGLSHFLEHMFFKGTVKRPSTLVLSSELDSLGCEFNAFTSKEYTGYYVKAAKDKINKSLDIVSDMLLNSKFEQEEIDRERGVIIEEMNMYEDNPLMDIEDVFEKLLYGNTPAGWGTIGFKENLLCFKRQDFLDYYNSQYGKNSAFLLVAGGVNKDVVKQAEKFFAGLADNKFKEKLKVVEKQTKPQLLVKYKKTDQAHIALGVRTLAYGHKDNYNLKLLSIILGGSMSSRLFTELRERRGLAYYVRAKNEVYSDTGYLFARAGVPLNKVEKSVAILLKEFKKISTELVTEAEIKRAKSFLLGNMAINLESSDDLAQWYAGQVIMEKDIVSPEEFAKNIKKVTAKDILRVAKNLIKNQTLNLAIIGKIEKAQEKRISTKLHF